MSASSRRHPSSTDRFRTALIVLGPAAVLIVGWASTAVRDTMAIANVALVMALITVAVAVASWKAGLATSVVAALALNYFHTDPVHSLRVTSQVDVVAVSLLGSIGVGVSIAMALRIRMVSQAHHESRAEQGRTLLVTASAVDRPVSEVWGDAVQASCAGLALVDCRIEPTGASNLPSIARHRPHVNEPDIFVLPEKGAVLRFEDSRNAAQVVLTPIVGMGALSLDRRVVMSFVDHLEVALAASAGQAAH